MDISEYPDPKDLEPDDLYDTAADLMSERQCGPALYYAKFATANAHFKRGLDDMLYCQGAFTDNRAFVHEKEKHDKHVRRCVNLEKRARRGCALKRDLRRVEKRIDGDHQSDQRRIFKELVRLHGRSYSCPVERYF